jgi:O-antigen ligase
LLTVFASATVISVALYRIKTAILLFVLLMPFLPRSLGVSWGSEGAVTFSRILIPILILMYIFKIRNPRIFRAQSKAVSIAGLLFIIGLLGLIKIISAMLNQASVLLAFDDAVRNLGVLFLFCAIGQQIRFERLSYVILISLVVSAILTLAEIAIERPLHSNLAISSGVPSLLEGSMRDGQYRAQAIFDGTLFFSEFVLLCFVLFLYRSNSFGVALRFLGLLLFLYLYLVTGARSLMISSFVVICAISYFRLRQRLGAHSRLSLAFITFLLVGASAAFSYLYIDSLGGNGALPQFNQMDSYTRSSTARALQFFEAFRLLRENPILGVGFRQNYVSGGYMHTLDNYYVRVSLESGIVGLMIFATFFMMLLSRLNKIIAAPPSVRAKRLATYLFVLTLAFLTFRFFFQDPSGLVLYFAIIGVGLANLESEYQNLMYTRR